MLIINLQLEDFQEWKCNPKEIQLQLSILIPIAFLSCIDSYLTPLPLELLLHRSILKFIFLMLFHLIFTCNKQLILIMLYFLDLQYLNCLNYFVQLVTIIQADLKFIQFDFLYLVFKEVHALGLIIEEFKCLFKYLVVFLLLVL